MLFWLLASALVAVALALVVPPLLRRQALTADGESRTQINVDLYRERVAELRHENLTPQQFEQAKLELEQTLAQELDTGSEAVAAPARAQWAGFLVLVLVPALGFGGYWLSSDARHQQVAMEQQQGQQAPDVESMLTRLTEHLQQEPDDEKGWRMLARSLSVLERYQDANPAFARLMQLTGGKDPEVLTDYAENLALSADANLSGTPEQLLKQSLELDPRGPKTLWLLGMGAVQQGQFAQARDYWQSLLPLLESGSEDQRSVQQHLEELAGMLSTAPPADAVHAQAEAVTNDETQAEVQAETQVETATAPAQLRVRVELSGELSERLNPNHTLFIYARAVNGPRMPLAIVRKLAADLPLEVSLDDSMSMMPAMKLSAFDQVVVAARVSASGNALPATGDLLGESAPLDPRAQGGNVVEVVIDHALP